MIKKVFLASLLCFPMFGNMNIQAEEMPQNEVVEDGDLSEEIEMFDSFYQDPDRYIFQDIDGNEVNVYVLEHKDDFYRNQYATTDLLMEEVRSVQDLHNVIVSYAGYTKTWANQKVYYTKTKYVVYTATGTYNVIGGRITSGTCTVEIIYKGSANYFIDSTSSKVNETGTITFTIIHCINGTNYTTKHTAVA